MNNKKKTKYAKKEDIDVPGRDLTDEDRALLDEEQAEEDDGTGSGDDSTGSGNDDDTLVVGSERQTLVTREGLKTLKDELEQLERTRRKEVAARLKEAIAYGDLSENSEYEDAKNEQAFVEGRIIELTGMIKNVKIITEKTGSGKTVRIGSTVKIQNLTEKDEPETYTIVGATEADPMENKISNESPIGAAIIDRDQGEEVIVKAPAGEFKYNILKVS